MLDILVMIAGMVCVILLWIMLYDSNRFVVKKSVFKDERIQKEYRAVLLADLHNKQYGKKNEKLLAAIEEASPDGIWIAGDMVTSKAGKKMTPALELLEALSGKYPIFYVNGNHEQRLELYPEIYKDMGSNYEETLKKLGIQRMKNQRRDLPGGIAVYGCELDKSYYRRFEKKGMPPDYLEGLLGKPDNRKYTVLIVHNPDYFPEYANWGADLVLAGHVHGGLVRIPGGKGIVSPSVRLFPEYDGGLFQRGKSRMLLSRGLGAHTIPVRLFNPGELHVIDLKPVERKRGEEKHGDFGKTGSI